MPLVGMMRLILPWMEAKKQSKKMKTEGDWGALGFLS